MSRPRRLVVVLVILAGVCLEAGGEPSRFPRPDLDPSYEKPITTTPMPRASAMALADTAVLAGALGLAAWLALRRRSRGGLVLLAAASLVYLGLYRKGCVCSVGSVQNVVAGLVDPQMVLPLSVIAFFVLPLLVALLFGRVFCAGVCPLGALQELVLLRAIDVPRPLAEVLGLLRHVYLAMAVLLAATGARYIVCAYDPFIPLLRGSGGSAMVITGGAMVLLATVVARPYCRFLCPYGVLLGWASRLASFRLQTAARDCFDCRLCEGSCPSGALLLPTPPLAAGARSGARRRVVRALLLTPLVVVGCAWLGSSLDWLLARTHPTVRVAKQVLAEEAGAVDGTTLESRTFRAGTAPTEALLTSAQRIETRYRIGGAMVGAYLGLVVMVKLLLLSRHRRRDQCEPNVAECFACGRCLEHCPQTSRGALIDRPHPEAV